MLSLATLALGWPALWLYARHEAARVLDTWLGDEARHGRDWSCPDRSITGFPLHLHMSCTRPTFTGVLGGDQVSASLASVEADVALYQPKAVDVQFAGPLVVGRRDLPAVTLRWDDLHLRANALANGLARANLVASGLSGQEGDARPVSLRSLEIGAAPAPGHEPAEGAYEVAVDLVDVTAPPVDDLLGSTDPMTIKQRGLLTGVVGFGGRLPALLERWRAAGGRLGFAPLVLTRGDVKLEARGDVGLDPDHRLEGRLDATVAGYSTVAARLGLPQRAVAVGTVLAGLFGRAKPTAEQAAPGTVTLPVLLEDGRV
ncbi:MAG: DUF2125 domain-containing protein, partial [Parafilimonas terrae]|nr:DUF2125 domain-containing protein [Parafilimonas terrae]